MCEARSGGSHPAHVEVSLGPYSSCGVTSRQWLEHESCNHVVLPIKCRSVNNDCFLSHGTHQYLPSMRPEAECSLHSIATMSNPLLLASTPRIINFN